MNFNVILLPLVLASSLGSWNDYFLSAGITRIRLRTTVFLNLTGAILKLLLIGYMLRGVQHDQSYVLSLQCVA